MSNRALEGLEIALGVKPKKAPPKPKPKVVPPAPVVEAVYVPDNVVRVPRTTPANKTNKVAAYSDANTLLEKKGFAKTEETEARREIVLAWMLNGHLHDGQLTTVTELATALAVPTKTVQNDVATIKEKMGDFHTTEDLKDVPALAHMLMEMKFQDRGRALALYNIIMGDIDAADKFAAASMDKPQARKAEGLTGRDRASMYSAALQALDLSNKATNGMESLFKITGGAKRLEAIIKAKGITINNNNIVMYTSAQLQEVAADALGGVLPSVRKINKQLEAPKVIELDAADLKVMDMGNQK